MADGLESKVKFKGKTKLKAASNLTKQQKFIKLGNHPS